MISFSLKDITLVLTMLVNVGFLFFAYRACSRGEVTCNNIEWPMISDILALKPYDRWFIFLSTVYMLGIMQINMRAYFKKVYGFIPNKTNDRIFYTGLASCFALPMIGIFDEHEFRPIHYVFAGIFFSCFTLYAVWLGHAMY